MTTKTTLQDMIELDRLHIPDEEPLPDDHPGWAALSEAEKAVIVGYIDLASKSRTLLIDYRELFREAEALRAERDMLLAKLEGHTVTAH